MRIIVDYGRGYGPLFDSGCFDQIQTSPEIERHFPVEGNGQIELELDWRQFDDLADAELRRAQLRMELHLATPLEMSSYIVARRGQVPDPLFALGQVWQTVEGDRYVVRYSVIEGRRILGLFWENGPEEMSALGPKCYFAVVTPTS